MNAASLTCPQGFLGVLAFMAFQIFPCSSSILLLLILNLLLPQFLLFLRTRLTMLILCHTTPHSSCPTPLSFFPDLPNPSWSHRSNETIL
jgi:hypothetical protein